MSSRVTSTTGIYLDGTPITEVDPSLGDIGTFDIDRIKVLRGPQGTLFGSASMGGTVRVITNKPKLDRVEGVVDGQLSGTAHGGTNYEVDGMKLGHLERVGWARPKHASLYATPA